MKAAGGLFSSIAEYGNVSSAAWKAARGKRERASVKDFFAGFESQIASIVQHLDGGTLRFSGYDTFTVRDPKIRLIHAPAFRDRVVHHAMIAILGPVFESGALDRSYACRRGKGQHAALRRAQQWMARKDWFMKLDVAKFYDSIHHRHLLDRLARRFREKKVIHLFERLLDSYSVVPGMGLPIGALTSQYLGNFYLDSIDHLVLQSARMPKYLRYMDDMLFIGERRDLATTRSLVGAALADMGLAFKGGGIINRCTVGVPFLGFTIYPDRIRLDPRGRRRLRSKWKNLEKACLAGQISEPALATRSEALFAHASFADDLAWRQEVIKFSRFGEGLETDPCSAGRFLEQYRDELPLSVPQQEQGGQPQQEQRFPCLFVSRHGDHGAEAPSVPPDDVLSRARWERSHRDKTTHKSSSPADIQSPEGSNTEEGSGRGSNF